jgi:hypothetical protein
VTDPAQSSSESVLIEAISDVLLDEERGDFGAKPERAFIASVIAAEVGKHEGDELRRLRAENEALMRSWNIDAEHRDACFAALSAVWGDMRGTDKHHVPSEVIALVREAIGDDLDPHDPAASRG